MARKRKQVKHTHELGDFHELTFSCYRHIPLLIDELWLRQLCVAIARAIERHSMTLVAFVIMPEHVHLLVFPVAAQPRIDQFLYAVKRPYSYRIKQLLCSTRSAWLERLTVEERPGKTVFRFWQEGPGYDRNLNTQRAVMSAIDYIHANPVRRGLVARPIDWKWSSARWYASDRQDVDPDLPPIDGVPPGLI